MVLASLFSFFNKRRAQEKDLLFLHVSVGFQHKLSDKVFNFNLEKLEAWIEPLKPFGEGMFLFHREQLLCLKSIAVFLSAKIVEVKKVGKNVFQAHLVKNKGETVVRAFLFNLSNSAEYNKSLVEKYKVKNAILTWNNKFDKDINQAAATLNFVLQDVTIRLICQHEGKRLNALVFLRNSVLVYKKWLDEEKKFILH